jgi:hypothetical protein
MQNTQHAASDADSGAHATGSRNLVAVKLERIEGSRHSTEVIDASRTSSPKLI